MSYPYQSFLLDLLEQVNGSETGPLANLARETAVHVDTLIQRVNRLEATTIVLEDDEPESKPESPAHNVPQPTPQLQEHPPEVLERILNRPALTGSITASVNQQSGLGQRITAVEDKPVFMSEAAVLRKRVNELQAEVKQLNEVIAILRQVKGQDVK
jgi:hypothetical protein